MSEKVLLADYEEGRIKRRIEMIYFKRCPRCKGDLREGSDTFGSYIACLQCGCYFTDAEELALLYSSSSRHMALSTRAASLPNDVEAVKRAS